MPPVTLLPAKTNLNQIHQTQSTPSPRQLQRQQGDLQGQVDARRRAVEGAKAGYARAVAQMGEVREHEGVGVGVGVRGEVVVVVLGEVVAAGRRWMRGMDA
jgi:hypothetical protein